MSSATIFGGAALSRGTQEDSDKVLELLLKYGVNHIDTAASYGNSEALIGPWMEKYRGDFFLATKTGNRTYEEAWKDINRSLERLRVDRVDLIQLHNLVHPDDWDVAMGDDGALKAVVEAKEQGLTRFVGVTGHGLMIAAMHKRSLDAHPFDSVLLPWNYVLSKEERYGRDFNSLFEICKDRKIAVQTIKSITKGPWAEKSRQRNTWYEPLEGQGDVDRAVSWILGQGYIFLNTVADVNLLPKVLDAASRFDGKPSEDEMDSMVDAQRMSRLFVS
jgi:aryl-alcohol dehydrogenase-like predicted oxidoreductase